jgi:hypothetical protein
MRERTSRHASGQLVTATAVNEGSLTAECFADDVVIDFPSMLPAVDRIRNSFVEEERPLPLRAAIELSHREARYGALVPLDVPVRSTCRHCGGRGGSWSEACRHCDGSGVELRRHRLQVAVPAGVIDGARFLFTVAPRRSPPTRIELRVFVEDARPAT